MSSPSSKITGRPPLKAGWARRNGSEIPAHRRIQTPNPDAPFLVFPVDYGPNRVCDDHDWPDYTKRVCACCHQTGANLEERLQLSLRAEHRRVRRKRGAAEEISFRARLQKLHKANRRNVSR